MRVFASLPELRQSYPDGLPGSVVSIGNFDGLHQGHQKLLQSLKAQASRRGLPSVVMTFDPHPLKILRPEKNIFRLFPRQDQEEQLRRLGVDFLFRVPFDASLAQTSAEEFFLKFIYEPLRPRAVVMGHDFHFGRNREGNLAALQTWGARLGYEVEQVPAFQMGGEVVSSSRVRELLARADLVRVRELLGREYFVQGEVQRGDGRGEKLGFPTANLPAPEGLALPRGVYITRVKTAASAFGAVTNLGVNPTFADPARQLRVESFIFNLNHDIYGETIKVEFYKFLRPEKKFKDAAELVQQITKDVRQAQEYWNGSSETV